MKNAIAAALCPALTGPALIMSVLMVAGTGVLFGQQPEKIEKLTKRMMPHEWYAEQETLWKSATEKSPTDANAWLNYYMASRYAGFGDTITDPGEKDRAMQKLIGDMGSAIPNSFEYHYCKWWAGGNSMELFPELQKAFEIRPDYALLSEDFISYYELAGDHEKVEFFSKKWYETRDMSPGLLDYNYNVLMSLEKNAILVTVGDNDTYPIWMLQYARGIRPDVTVINAGLISANDYRSRMMKEHHIAGDSTKLNWERFEKTPYQQCMAEFLKSVAEQNSARPVYFGLTCDPSYLTLIKDDLYTVGLANKYSSKRIDNVAILKRNWKKFRLDYVDLDFYSESYPFSGEGLKSIDMNYVTPALLLYEHYNMAGDNDRAEEFRRFALAVGRAGNQEKEVGEYIASIGHQEESTTEPYQMEKETIAKAQESSFSKGVKVYPNPAYSTLTIQLPETTDAEIALVDLAGNVRQEKHSSSNSVELNIEGLTAGTYIVRIKTPAGTTSRTIEVAR